jgi:hypothetical protein
MLGNETIVMRGGPADGHEFVVTKNIVNIRIPLYDGHLSGKHGERYPTGDMLYARTSETDDRGRIVFDACP